MAIITVEQVVRETIWILGDIRVPASMTNDIAIPISKAITNLNACCEAWAREAAESAEKKQETLFPGLEGQEITEEDIRLEIEPEPGMEPLMPPKEDEEK